MSPIGSLSLYDLSQVESLYEKHDQVVEKLYLDRRFKGKKSNPEAKFYFFHDLVLQYSKSKSKKALSYFDGDDGVWTYLDLAKAIKLISKDLRNNGFSKGSKLLLVNLTGVTLLLYILAAISIGCVFCVINIQFDNDFQRFLLGKKLNVVSPDGVLTGENNLKIWLQERVRNYRALFYEISDLKVIKKRIEIFQKSDLCIENSATYKANEPICIEFDRGSIDSCMPYTLSAQELFQALMLNSYYALSLKRDDKLVVFKLNEIDFQYQIMITALFSGCHLNVFCEKNSRFISQNPLKKTTLYKNYLSWFRRFSNHVLLISKSLRDYVSEGPMVLKQSRSSFVLNEMRNDEKWKEFRANHLLGCDQFQAGLLWMPVMGGVGALSFSNKITDVTSNVPLPGRKTILVDQQAGVQSINDFGYCAYPLVSGDLYITQLGVAVSNDQFSYFGNTLNDLPYPLIDIEQYLHANSENEKVWMLYYFLPNSLAGKKETNLVVFLCAKNPLYSDFDKSEYYELARNITQSLFFKSKENENDDVDYSPSQISYFYLYPRGEGSVKENLINSQYSQDLLKEKSELPIYNSLSEIRCLLSSRL